VGFRPNAEHGTRIVLVNIHDTATRRGFSGALMGEVIAFLVGTIVTGNLAVADLSSRALIKAPEAKRCVLAYFSARGVSIESAVLIGDGARLCRVTGQVVTSGEGAPDGTAGFQLDLPDRWNGKLLFNGGGGFNGYLPQPDPKYTAKGYASLGTDTGHRIGREIFSGSWAQKPSGERDSAKVADYLFRAIPQVNRNIRPLIAQYYGTTIKRAYFKGCSNGGREAMFQAQKNPGDFDGFIAGDPSTVRALGMPEVWKVKVLKDDPIPYSKLPAIDTAIKATCDLSDGLKDELIQNPAGCSFDPQDLVKPGLLTLSEARGLTNYLSAIYDDSGELVEPGASSSGSATISNFPGIEGSLAGISSYMNDPAAPNSKPVIQKLAAQGLAGDFALNDPGLDLYGPLVFTTEGKLRHDVVERAKRTWASGIANPAKMAEMYEKDVKLLIYHGLSDADTSPYETWKFYEMLVKDRGGLSATRRNARLFLVPEMDHCMGGDGPNVFDPVEALDNWVVKGSPPDKIIATKFTENDPTKGIARTMPVCAFPTMAHYKGSGARNQAKNWGCDGRDHALLNIGVEGRRAGLDDTPMQSND
jgi:feruloyl esterase